MVLRHVFAAGHALQGLQAVGLAALTLGVALLGVKLGQCQPLLNQLALWRVELAVKVFQPIEREFVAVLQAVFGAGCEPLVAPVLVGAVIALAQALQLLGFEAHGQLGGSGLDVAQQGDEAALHVMRHGAHLRCRHRLRGHGLKALQHGRVLRQLVLAMPLLQVLQGVAHQGLLRVLQVHIAVEPPIHKLVAAVVGQLQGAASAQAQEGGNAEPAAGMSDNSLS